MNQTKSLRLMAVLLTALISPTVSMLAQTSVFWDINGTTPGAGGTTPGGIGAEWNTTNAFWNTASDGGAGTLGAWTAGNIAVFSAGTDASGSFTIGVQGTHDIRGLTFQEGSVTLQGGTLNLTGASTLDVAEAMTATLSDLTLTGAFGLTKNGKGTLVLSGTSTSSFSGDFNLFSGTVELATAGGSALGDGDILIESSSGGSGNVNPSTLRLTADNQIGDSAHVTVISRQFRAALFDLNGYNETIGGLTVTALTGTVGIGVRTGTGGVLTVNGDIFLHNDRAGTGNNPRDVLITGTGNRSVVAPDSGILDLGGGVRTISVASQATTVFPDSDATIETTIRNGGIIKEGPQMLILTGTNTYLGGTTISEGTLRIGAGSTTGSILGDVVNNAVLEFTRSNAYTFDGDITGTGVLNKLGTGVLTLTGNNSYGGLTNILNGTLKIEKLGMAGSATETQVGTQSAIQLGSGTTSVGLTYTGAGETTDKILRFTGTTGVVTLSASGTGAVVFQNAFDFSEAGSKTLTLSGTSTAVNTVGGGITDPVGGGVTSLLKTGDGTWALAGNNSYTGSTTVNGGTLRLTGSGTLPQKALIVQNGIFEIAGDTDLTLTGDSTLKLAAAELISYGVFLGGGSTGSAAAISIAPDRTLNLSSHVAYSTTNHNLGANISGGTLHLGDGLRVFTIGNSTSADPELTVSSTVTSGTNTTLMKAGLGRLVFTQSLSVSKAQVNGGRLDFGGTENVISGSLQVGMNNTASAYYATAGGSLLVGSGVADTLDVGTTVNQQAYSYTSNFNGILDLRGSESFVADVGTVRVGVHTSGGSLPAFAAPTDPSLDGVATPSGLTPANNSFYMATNNTITARTNFVVGDAASASVSGTHQVQFGEGLNVVSTPAMYIGYRKGSGSATLRSGGSLEVKGVGAGAKTALYVGYNAVNTGGATTNMLDLSAGTFIADLSLLTIGWKSSGSGATAGSSIATMTIGTGSSNAVNVSGNVVIGNIGGAQASATSFGRGTLNMGGGTFTVGGDVELAKIATTGSGATNASLTSTGTLNLTGGSFTVNGNITRLADSLNRNTATITLDGGMLDMTAGNIGSSAAPIVFNVRQGELRGLSEFNGGAPLMKTTAGLLTLGGVNSYSGGTHLQDGTLEVLAGSRTGLGGMSIQGSGAILAGEGTVSANTVFTLGSIRPGANGGSGNGLLTFAGDLTLNAAPASSASLVLGISSPTGIADLETYEVTDIPGHYDFGTYNSEVNNLGDHDLMVVQGSFTWNNGTRLIVQDEGASYSYGQVFNLLDWAGLLGGGPTFASNTSSGGVINDFLTLPSFLGTDYLWDLSLFGSHGVLVVVPEPGRAAFLLLSFSILMVRCRR